MSYDFDINNYTIDEMYNLLKLNTNCTLDELHKQANKMQYELSENKDAVVFIDNCKRQLEILIREKTQPYNDEISKDNLNYNPNDDNSNPKNTIFSTYSSTPLNYNELKRDSMFHDESSYIKRNLPTVVNTHSHKLPTGVINPIERRTIKRLLSMDTLFRTNYKTTMSTNASWKLPYPVENVVSMKISSLQIPNMWFAFSGKKKNNYFTVMMTGVNFPPYSEHEVYTNKIEIPDGNYLTDEFMEMMNNLLKNTENGMEFFLISISSHTSKTTIHVNQSFITPQNSPNFEYVIMFDDPNNYSKHISNSCIYTDCDIEKIKEQYDKEYYEANIKTISQTAGWMMGFKEIVYKRSWNNTKINMIGQTPILKMYAVLESESSFGSSILNCIYIAVEDYNKNFITNSIIAQTGDSYLGLNILGRITVSSGQLTIINDNSSDMIFKMREYMGPVSLDKLNIKVLDKYGTIIDLNGNDYSIALELECLYN